jgi:DNA-binding transcriptional MerR regulator
MPYEGHRTISEMAQEFNTSVDRLRTIIARELIQPVRFPHDMRLLYYKPEDIERIKRILDIKRG